MPGFGDPEAQLLILGLAPSIDGGNRTGRIFTGDPSARFLIPALHAEGFANQPFSESREDGLELLNCYITASVKCVPPGHKPLKEELITCSRYYKNEYFLLKKLKVVLALGKFAFDAHLNYQKMQGENVQGMHFEHGACYEFKKAPKLYAAFHPSPQNTQTGKLTTEMFKDVLRKIKASLN